MDSHGTFCVHLRGGLLGSAVVNHPNWFMVSRALVSSLGVKTLFYSHDQEPGLLSGKSTLFLKLGVLCICLLDFTINLQLFTQEEQLPLWLVCCYLACLAIYPFFMFMLLTTLRKSRQPIEQGGPETASQFLQSQWSEKHLCPRCLPKMEPAG